MPGYKERQAGAGAWGTHKCSGGGCVEQRGAASVAAPSLVPGAHAALRPLMTSADTLTAPGRCERQLCWMTTGIGGSWLKGMGLGSPSSRWRGRGGPRCMWGLCLRAPGA